MLRRRRTCSCYSAGLQRAEALQPRCTLYKMFAAIHRTCLDQGAVVVFADKFNPAKPEHISVPSFDMSNIMVRPLPIITCVYSYPNTGHGMLLNPVLAEHTQKAHCW